MHKIRLNTFDTFDVHNVYFMKYLLVGTNALKILIIQMKKLFSKVLNCSEITVAF
jgi:hypothetical protein